MDEAWKEILIFGDSVMKGVVLEQIGERYRRFPILAKEQIEADYRIKLNNRAHFGQTIVSGAREVYRVIEQVPNCQVVALEFGGNDCDFDWQAIHARPDAKHQPRTPLDLFTRTYTGLIEALKQRKITPIVMNLPPIDSERYLDFICLDGLSKDRILEFLGDINMIYRFQELYSQTIEKIAVKTGALLIDVRGAFLKRLDFRDLISIDGIHPNLAGHELLYETIRLFIEEHMGKPGFAPI